MNNCNKYIEQMNIYLDGELKGSRISELLEHIERCPNCKRRFEALKIISFQTRQTEINPPLDLHEKIMENIKNNSLPAKKKLNVNVVVGLLATAAVFAFFVSGMFKGFASDFLFYKDRSAAQPANSNYVAYSAGSSTYDAVTGTVPEGADKTAIIEAAKQAPLISNSSVYNLNNKFSVMKVYSGVETLPEFILEHSPFQDQESMLYYVYVDKTECDDFEGKLTDSGLSETAVVQKGADIDPEAEEALYVIKLG